jgi:hypothetical protein
MPILIDMSGGFDQFEKKAKNSNIGLKSDLKIHMFGPYEGFCSHILEEISEKLRRKNYETYTCAELDYPDIPSGLPRDQENWVKSVNCLERADVAVFIFLEPFDERVLDPDKSPEEMNSSVCTELNHWISGLDKKSHRTFVVFEGEMREAMGSLINGIVLENSIESIDVSPRGYPEMYDQIRAQCWSWVNRFC